MHCCRECLRDALADGDHLPAATQTDVLLRAPLPSGV
jgi:hypothetical protein